MTPEEANNRLFEAARSGKLNDAVAALDAGADPNASDDWKWTPLHWAARNGHADLARLLIEKGADPNAVDDRRWTPLHCAAFKGHADLLELLRDASGANTHAGRVAKRRDNDEPQFG